MSYELISVVLPVYRQAGHVRDIVLSCETALAKVPVDHELLVVVNGPPDGTLETCLATAEDVPAMRVIESERGWGRAVQRGLSEARGDLLCYANSARTTGDDLALTLLYAVAYPGVVIKASRKTRDSWRRRLGSLIYNLECRHLFDLSNFDINGTPKIFPRQFDRLLALRRSDDLIDAEFNAVCRRSGYPIIEVPILSTARRAGRSTTGYRSAARMYVGAYQLCRAMREEDGRGPWPSPN